VCSNAPDQRQGSRYVWTRKVQAKTVTVALSKSSITGCKQAVANQRKLAGKSIKRNADSPLSRQIIFETSARTPGANDWERKF
jgi:hypothetical protein